MDILRYILDNALILIPVLVIIGQIIKNIQAIPDKWIPLILLLLGVLVTGAAVYGNQLAKQLTKTE